MLAGGPPADAPEDKTPPPTGPAYPPPNPALPNPLRDSILSMAAQRKDYRTNPIYALHLRSSRRNTISTFTKPNGDVIATLTGGNVGFKKGNRSSFEAGYQCAVRTIERVAKEKEYTGGAMSIHLFLNGWGQGRDAIYRALMAQEGEGMRELITKITDKTPIKIGGTRAMKARRL